MILMCFLIFIVKTAEILYLLFRCKEARIRGRLRNHLQTRLKPEYVSNILMKDSLIYIVMSVVSGMHDLLVCNIIVGYKSTGETLGFRQPVPLPRARGQ